MIRSVSVAGICVVLLLLVAFFVYRSTMASPGTDPVIGAHAAAADAGSGGGGGVARAGNDVVDAGAGAAHEKETAEIIAARGKVEARVGEEGPWGDASIGQKLNTDDAVRAGRNGEATLRMGNGVEVRLSPRSEFSIRELTESTSKIRLEEGHVTASVDENGKRTLKVAARGTDAEAESKGGEFGVVTDGKGELAVATSTGSVKLTAAGESVDVGAGQTSAAVNGRAPSAPTAIPKSLYLKVGDLRSTKTRETSVTLTGVTAPGSVVRAGENLARVDEKGHFKVQVPLHDGDNTVAVDVVDASGRTKTQPLPTIVVDRKKPEIEAQTQWGTGTNAPPAPPN